MRNLLALTAFVMLCVFACKKKDEPAKPAAGIPSIDSITGTYHGNVHKHKDWYYPNVDSGTWDSTYFSTMLIAKQGNDSIKVTFNTDPGGSVVYYYLNSGQPCIFGDPQHGGSSLYLYASKDSAFYFSQNYTGTSQSHTNSTTEFKGSK